MTLSWSKLCRLCANSDDYQRIFEKYEHDKIIAEIILKYLSIKINLDDGSRVCNDCGDKVKNFHTFAEHCDKIQTFFQTHMDLILLENNEHLQNLKSKFFASIPSLCIKEELDTEFPNDTIDFVDNEIFNQVDSSQFNTNNDNTLKFLEKKFSDPLEQKKKRISKKSSKIIIKSEKNKMIDVTERKISESNNHIDISNILSCELDDDNKSNVELANNTISKNKRKYSHIDYSSIAFNCHICEKEFKKWGQLESHGRKYHNDKPKVICQCKKIIRTKSTLERHIKRHLFPENYLFKCEECEKIFVSISGFKEHRKSHSIRIHDLQYSCKVCGKCFAKQNVLKKHEKIHLSYDERYIWKCDICDSKFCGKVGLISHKKYVHEKQRNFICDYCGKSFLQKKSLEDHKLGHENIKNYTCNDCQKSFITKSKLIRHMNVHSDIGYQCSHCSKLFSTRITLKNHMVIHSNEAKYICSYCNKACKRRKDLVSHLKKHTGERPYACEWCPLTFSNASNFRMHFKREHPLEFQIAEKSNPYTTLIGTKREKVKIIQF